MPKIQTKLLFQLTFLVGALVTTLVAAGLIDNQLAVASPRRLNARDILPRNCAEFLMDLARATKDASLVAHTANQLHAQLTARARLRFGDYIHLSIERGTYVGEARGLDLLQNQSVPVSLTTQAAIEEGLMGFGLAVSLNELQELFSYGSLIPNEDQLHSFLILTKSHSGSVPSHHVLGANQVMLILSPRALDDVPTAPAMMKSDGSIDFEEAIKANLKSPQLRKATRASLSSPRLDASARLAVLESFFSIPIWAVQGLVASDRMINRVREDHPSIPSSLFTHDIQKTKPQPSLLKRSIRIFEPIHATTRIGIQDPPRDIHYPTSKQLLEIRHPGFWLILIGSTFRIKTKAKHIEQGRLVEIKYPSTAPQQLSMRLVLADDWVETIDFDQIEQIDLIDYVPRGPGLGIVSVPYSFFRFDPSFLRFLTFAPNLSRPLTLVPDRPTTFQNGSL